MFKNNVYINGSALEDLKVKIIKYGIRTSVLNIYKILQNVVFSATILLFVLTRWIILQFKILKLISVLNIYSMFYFKMV